MGLFAGCASQKEAAPSGLEIQEVKPDKWTALTRQNILHLAQVYDLGPLLFTKRINIETGSHPSSHPVLTLNTQHAEYPNRLLAQLLHEELHWWTSQRTKEIDLAIKDLVKIYPKVPHAKNEKPYVTYLHLIVCYAEFRTLEHYLGKKEARNILTQSMQKNKNLSWAYYQVLYKDFALKKVVEKHKLLPPPL